jgi:GGDEF domain-containing protein
MTLYHETTTPAELKAIIDELSTSHLGILSPAAIRLELARETGPVDLIALDFRKLHEWNDILGYDVANVYFGAFARTRLDEGRAADVRGQWAGDEVVIACAAGDGLGLLLRLIRALSELSEQLGVTDRATIQRRTGGLLDGFAAVFVLIPGSTHVLADAERAIVECGILKRGVETGDRATSGRAGTIVGTLDPS